MIFFRRPKLDSHRHNGFTRPELLAALLLTVLLASIAIALIQTLTIREQVQQALDDSLTIRHAVARHILELGEAPEDEAAAGLEPQAGETVSEFLQGVRVSRGRIVLVFGKRAHQRIAMSQLVLTPYLDEAGLLEWRCGNGPEPGGNPLSGDPGQVDGGVPAYYLPAKCRP
jgi:Tfp pilus assembly major pilin PilA